MGDNYRNNLPEKNSSAKDASRRERVPTKPSNGMGRLVINLTGNVRPKPDQGYNKISSSNFPKNRPNNPLPPAKRDHSGSRPHAAGVSDNRGGTSGRSRGVDLGPVPSSFKKGKRVPPVVPIPIVPPPTTRIPFKRNPASLIAKPESPTPVVVAPSNKKSRKGSAGMDWHNVDWGVTGQRWNNPRGTRHEDPSGPNPGQSGAKNWVPMEQAGADRSGSRPLQPGVMDLVLYPEVHLQKVPSRGISSSSGLEETQPVEEENEKEVHAPECNVAVMVGSVSVPSSEPRKSARPVSRVDRAAVSDMVVGRRFPVPFTPRDAWDSPPNACWRCLGISHVRWVSCDAPLTPFCENCGRRGWLMHECSRCSRTYLRLWSANPNHYWMGHPFSPSEYMRPQEKILDGPVVETVAPCNKPKLPRSRSARKRRAMERALTPNPSLSTPEPSIIEREEGSYW